MKYLIKTAAAGLFSLLVLSACNDDLSVPPQPDFITVSLGENMTVDVGTPFDLIVPDEEHVDYYVWTLPEILEVVSGETEAKITVYAKEEGIIDAGEISVRAYNSAGASYVRTFYKVISVVTPI